MILFVPLALRLLQCPVVVATHINPEALPRYQHYTRFVNCSFHLLVAIRHQTFTLCKLAKLSGSPLCGRSQTLHSFTLFKLAKLSGSPYWTVPDLSCRISSFINLYCGIISSQTKKAAKFPVSFFEELTCVSEDAVLQSALSLGGDVLHVCSADQAIHRLRKDNTEYLMAPRSDSFKMKVYLQTSEHVIAGIRILVGKALADQTSSSVTIMSRTIHLSKSGVSGAHWYDLPMTRQEMIAAVKDGVAVTLGITSRKRPGAFTLIDCLNLIL